MNDVVLNVLPTASAITPLPVRFSPIEPALVPVAPLELAVTVQVALGDPAAAVAEAMVGTPVMPPRASPKFVVAAPLTGSENVTVHDNDPPLTACAAPARSIEVTVGRVVS